jgi:hypothetical protein
MVIVTPKAVGINELWHHVCIISENNCTGRVSKSGDFKTP